MTNSATIGCPLPREDETECHVSREGTVEFLGRDVSGQRRNIAACLWNP